jgi:hypothetical protein
MSLLPGQDRGHAARILVAVTFHFDASRLGFLAEVLRSLSEFPVAAMRVAIVTNTARTDDVDVLHRLSREIFSNDSTQVRSYENLAHPFDLAWCHKAIIASEFVGENAGRYTHFIYLEDDIRLSFSNFGYFVDFRERLRDFGLLPAFVRMEYSRALGGFVASDAFWPVYVPVADGSIGLRVNQYYVAADLDGIVRNDRSWCRAFEQFRLMRTDTVDGLAILQRHSWISHCAPMHDQN